jgi:hypothetical protein
MIKQTIKLRIEEIQIRKDEEYDGISWRVKEEKQNILNNY